MPRARAEEEWARRILSRALQADVDIHDTGTASSMYDLEITYTGGSRAAAEVVAAADADSISLWRLVNDRSDRRWQVEGLVGGWSVSLDPRARGKRVLAELPDTLRRLESHGVNDIRNAFDASFEYVQTFGVRDARQFPTDFPGSIYVMIDGPLERMGGMVPETGNPLGRWIGNFLSEEGRQDVRTKLAASMLPERHAVVFVPSFTVAPFQVIDLLIRDEAPLPEDRPSLPEEITHVWAFSSWNSGVAFHWSPSAGWIQHPKL